MSVSMLEKITMPTVVLNAVSFAVKPTIHYTDLPPMVVKEPTLVDRFVEALQVEVAAAGLHHVYPYLARGWRHLYTRQDENGVWTGDCLLGRVLIRMGLVDAATLHRYEGRPAVAVMQMILGYHQATPDVRSRVTTMAIQVQTVNDQHLPWGMALNVVRAARF